jgi:hypothetical protein
MPAARRLLAPLLAALALGGIALALSACGSEADERVVSEGETVTLGEVQYNVVFSRFLNPDDTEDSAYLVGQPPPSPDSHYFGVFLEAQNDSKSAQELPDSFTITDADRQTYDSIASESLYAFPLGGEVEAEEQVPVLDSTPQQGPIGGSLVLFELTEEATQNRPLVLEIESPDGPAEVTLDL